MLLFGWQAFCSHLATCFDRHAVIFRLFELYDTVNWTSAADMLICWYACLVAEISVEPKKLQLYLSLNFLLKCVDYKKWVKHLEGLTAWLVLCHLCRTTCTRCINQQTQSIKCNKVQTKYSSWPISNCYMFRHRSFIFRKSTITKTYNSNTLIQV